MRDNFSKLTKDILAARVGYRCSNPDCSRPTSGPRADPEKAVNLGIASHITAAALGGPRYDPHLSPQQRKSMSNAIWLCQLCAKLIDSDEERYKIEVLRDWKEQAEALAHAQLQRPASPYDFSAIPGFLEFLEILTLYVDNAIEETLDIHGFLHWIDANPDVGISPELQRVLALLKINPISGNNILRALSRRRSIGRQPDDELARIQDRLVQLYKNLIEDQVSEREQHRIRTSARLLEIASRNLVGTGVHADISNAFKNPSMGTLSFRWRIGDQSPNLMLVELVGGVLESRISTILNSNSSLSLRAYDPTGCQVTITSKPYNSGQVITIVITWDRINITLWIQGKIIGKRSLKTPFISDWSLMLAGIDIEGELSADTGQQGYAIDGLVGLNLGRNGLQSGARLSDVAIWGTVLTATDIKELARVSAEEVEAHKHFSNAKQG